MPAWGQPEFGLQPREIRAIVRYLVGQLPEPPPLEAVQDALADADTDTGRQLFNADCARCHGRDAVGTLLAPTLANPELLALASDRALYATVTRGRPSAGMPKMPGYSAKFLVRSLSKRSRWCRETIKERNYELRLDGMDPSDDACGRLCADVSCGGRDSRGCGQDRR